MSKSNQPNPCADPRMGDWAETIDKLLSTSSPAWKVYPYYSGHHLQLVKNLIDKAVLADIREALKRWGWTQRPPEAGEEIESWFYTTGKWTNPCKQIP